MCKPGCGYFGRVDSLLTLVRIAGWHYVKNDVKSHLILKLSHFWLPSIIYTVNSDLKYPGHGILGEGATYKVALGHGIKCQEYHPGGFIYKTLKK